jgi:hypothetical protein
LSVEAYWRSVNWRTNIQPKDNPDTADNQLGENLVYFIPTNKNLQGIKIGLFGNLSFSFSEDSDLEIGLEEGASAQTSEMEEIAGTIDMHYLILDFHTFTIKGMDVVGSMGDIGDKPENAPESLSGYRSDIKVENTEANLIVNFAPKVFSPAKSLNYQGVSKGKGMAFMLGAFWNELKIDSTNGLIPDFEQGDYGQDAYLLRAKFRSYGLQAGLGQSMNLPLGLVLAGQVMVGVGSQEGSFRYTTEETTNKKAMTQLDGRVVLGFNQSWIFGGLRFTAKIKRFNTEHSSVDSNIFIPELNLGIRF